ncbi:MAG: ABC transporter ATP-binding protein [Firmicutes bacterium]|nr:ABC transporter ATP-binding protein [Bacillota bacterium]
MIRTLLGYFRPHMKIFILDMCCALFVAAIDLSFPLVSRYAMYELIPNGLYQTLFTVMAIVVVAYLLRSLGYYIMTYWGHAFGVRVEADIRADLFHHLQELDFEFYDHNRTGTLMNRLTGDLFEITELSHHGPEDVLIATLTITGALIFMYSVQWRLALIVTILIPIFIIIVMLTRKNWTKASVNVKAKMAEINSDAEASISGIKTSKAFANEDVDNERFTTSNNRFKTAKSDYYKAMGTFMASQEFFMCILPVVVIAYGSKLIMDGKMNYIDLITFTLFVNSFVTPIRKLANFAEIFTSGTAGLKRFMEIMDTEPKVQDKADAVPLQVQKGGIQISDVSFSYDDRNEVIHNMNLNINPGETLAVVGHSGGGKTTLCQLVPRFYDVDSGSIKIDGQDIRDVTKKSIAANIGIVQQDVFIFADTVYNNISYGRPDATYDEVVEAAKKAKIYDDIMAMPDGFDTYVGERGTMLSGGQKQRISIARIFLKNPKILILDEATSALDTITEQEIQNSFEELAKGRTSMVIAHRLATVKNADRIVLIDGGKILEEGTHEELMKQNGGYAKLYNTQKLAG